MTGPTVRRRLLGAALRRLRTDADEKREQTAFILGCSPTKVTYLESGRNVVGKTELIVLLQHYGAEDRLPALEELRQEASKRGWWSTYGLPEWLAEYVGLESDAVSVRSVELELIPGLLQTEAYMRRLYTLPGARLSAKEVDRRIGARLKRQERLTGATQLHFSAVISQAALERCVRHETVAADQLAQLLDRATWPNVEVRVLPFESGMHAGMSGPFNVLSFPDHLLPDTVYQEYIAGGHVTDDAAVVSQLDTLFRELRSQALGTNESLAMIAQLAEHT